MENKTCYNVDDQRVLQDVTFLQLWLLTVPLIAICVITILANGAIILMFALRKKIRKCRNTYIFSLALANFMIGLTMPISIMETLSDQWPFGYQFCVYFLTLRYSLLYVTILSIILITVDRWWSINFPFSYRIKRSKRITFTLVAIIWIISFMVHLPSILGWNYIQVSSEPMHSYCRVPYEYNSGFVISASLIEFFIPLTLLLSLNMGIYIKLARRRNSKKIRRSLSSSDGRGRKTSSDSDNNNESDERADLIASLMQQRAFGHRNTFSIVTALRRLSAEGRQNNTHVARTVPPVISNRYRQASTMSIDLSSVGSSTQKKQSTCRTVRAKANNSNRHDAVVRDFLLRQDNKALFSLALLVITFVVCWTPAIICDIFYALCPSSVPMWLLTLSYWILSASAALNPFLYGIGSNDFRRVTKEWLFGNKKDTRAFEQIMQSQLFQPCDIIAMKNSIVLENRKMSCYGQFCNI